MRGAVQSLSSSLQSRRWSESSLSRVWVISSLPGATAHQHQRLPVPCLNLTTPTTHAHAHAHAHALRLQIYNTTARLSLPATLDDPVVSTPLAVTVASEFGQRDGRSSLLPSSSSLLLARSTLYSTYCSARARKNTIVSSRVRV